ncbi:hypothetical protein D3C77_485270 [compost metagenome]
MRKPKPRASELSGSYCKAASLRVSFCKASRKASKSSELTGNRPANTCGLTRWKPGSMATSGVAASVSVSPTGAPWMSLMLAMMKPTSPALRSAVSVCFGLNTPTLSTWCSLPVDLTRILSPFFSRPCLTRTSDTTPR